MKRTKIRFHRMLVAPALAGGMLLAASAPLLAQNSGGAPTTTERNAPAAQQPAEAQDGAEARARLNSQQAQFARGQLDNNASSQAEYERKLREVEDARARIAADTAAAQRAYEDEKARREAEYEEAMARWRADVAACQAGNTSRCAQQAVLPPI